MPGPLRVVHVQAHEQPFLPPLMVPYTNARGQTRLEKIPWPAQTRRWWRMWADSPLSSEFTATDWSELMDTARLHAEFWRGNLRLAAELRLRVAKFGATPEDRLRLRIQFAMATAAESKPAKVVDVAGAEDARRSRRLVG